MPGPLSKPDDQKRRRNAPTIPTTNLPASGRAGRIPVPPKHLVLGNSGNAWWKWAWHTPQAAAWGSGHEIMIARRAQLEDLWTDGVHTHSTTMSIAREMREMDDRLGLTPKGMAAMRWRIVDDTVPDPAPAPPKEGDGRWGDLRVVGSDTG